MPNFVLLSDKEHKDLKVISDFSADYGDQIMYSLTFPFEFRNIQGNYPIVFSRDADTETYTAICLFGFERGENLFLEDNKWDAPYVPLTVKRQPFLIGMQDTGEGAEPKVSIDLDSPRVVHDKSEALGEPLFYEHGGMTEFLTSRIEVLEAIHVANEHSERYIKALEEHNLLEPFTLEIPMSDGNTHQLVGFFAINEDALQELDGAALESLNKEGFLAPTFMALASLARVSDLILRKNARQELA